MYSWGPDCKLVTGAYGGVTYDATKSEFIHACEPWTHDRLPYSCTPLRLLAGARSRYTKEPPLEGNVEKQVDYYKGRQKPHRNAHIPEDVLKGAIMADRIANENDPLPAHNRVHLSTFQNYNRDQIIIFSHLSEHGAFGMARLYELPEPYNQSEFEILFDHYYARSLKTRGSVVKVASSQRAQYLAALTSTSVLHIWNMKECRQATTPEVINDDQAFDVELSAFGNSALLGTKSGCRIYDIQQQQVKQQWNIESVFGIKHVAVMCEFTNVAASVNKMIVLDNRMDRHHVLPFDIGGAPVALANGNATNSLLYLSGPERLAAIDLRKPKVPILQWQQRESFGGRLGMLKFVPINDGTVDMMTAVNLDTHELVMVPILLRQELNTVSVLSSAVQSSLNVNRAFVRLKGRQPIVGHDWLKLHDNQYLSIHMCSDGEVAYQMHSFSDKFKHCPMDQADLLTEELISKTLNPNTHPRLSHGELLLDCVTSKKHYMEVGTEQQEALAGWQVPLRSNRYIPRLLGRALSANPEQSVSECDPSLLSSAARILYKQWDH